MSGLINCCFFVEVIRNHMLLLLTRLARGSATLQNIVVFDNIFDHLFDIMRYALVQ